jgi:hypothetical protein
LILRAYLFLIDHRDVLGRQRGGRQARRRPHLADAADLVPLGHGALMILMAFTLPQVRHDIREVIRANLPLLIGLWRVRLCLFQHPALFGARAHHRD